MYDGGFYLFHVASVRRGKMDLLPAFKPNLFQVTGARVVEQEASSWGWRTGLEAAGCLPPLLFGVVYALV